MIITKMNQQNPLQRWNRKKNIWFLLLWFLLSSEYLPASSRFKSWEVTSVPRIKAFPHLHLKVLSRFNIFNRQFNSSQLKKNHFYDFFPFDLPSFALFSSRFSYQGFFQAENNICFCEQWSCTCFWSCVNFLSPKTNWLFSPIFSQKKWPS